MKNILVLLFLFVALGNSIKAQSVYTTTGGEWIFSWASVDYDGQEGNTTLRWSPIINFYNYWHYDVSENLGFMLGLGTHNIGFITDVPASVVSDNSSLNYTGEVRKKFRNYTLGIPIGIKVGVMKEMYLFGGYELEIPYLYKEKTFEDGEKMKKYTSWFSQQSPTIYNSAFVGVQLPSGTSFKFHYYFTDFFKQSYVQDNVWSQGRNFYPTKANMMYLSISQTIFRDKKIVKFNEFSGSNSRVAVRIK